MERSYLLRDILFFELFTQRMDRAGYPFRYYGASAPAVPVLKATHSNALQDCPNWVQPTLKKLASKALEVMYMTTRQYAHGFGQSKHTTTKLESPQRPNTTTGAPSQAERARAASIASPLMALPSELVLQIMDHLPASSLYCLRQTSTTFMTFFDGQQFEAFHQKSESSTGHIGFSVDSLFAAEKNDIANCLYHGMYCASCLEAEQRGTLADRLATLRSLRHCDGCNQQHASALFLPEDKERHDSGSRRLVCIGRLGEVTLCSHRSCKPTTWGRIEQYAQARAELRGADLAYKSVCTNLSHEPMTYQKIRPWILGSAFPRLIIEGINYPPLVYRVGYGWDLPLLCIDRTRVPTLATVRETLSKLVVSALHDHRMCPHISAEKEIRAFVQSGICNCFTQDECVTTRIDLRGCNCDRQSSLECRVCGAVYMWLLFCGQVVLSLRYLWHIQKPTSPGWLGMIDKRYRDKLFTEDNRHVLWCDTEECRTNKRRRWEALVKEDSERHFLAVPDDDEANTWDYEEMCSASKKSSFQNW